MTDNDAENLPDGAAWEREAATRWANRHGWADLLSHELNVVIRLYIALNTGAIVVIATFLLQRQIESLRSDVLLFVSLSFFLAGALAGSLCSVCRVSAFFHHKKKAENDLALSEQRRDATDPEKADRVRMREWIRRYEDFASRFYYSSILLFYAGVLFLFAYAVEAIFSS